LELEMSRSFGITDHCFSLALPGFNRLHFQASCRIFNVDTPGGLHMTARVQKWGNSLALRLPKALADELRLAPGSAVELRSAGGKLIVEPHRPPQFSLENLLKKVTRRNLHAEIKTGRPAGREAL
jgi:antitoxin MazE